MIQSFSDLLFDERHALGCKVILQYDVITHICASGKEQRVLKSLKPRRRFTLSPSIKSEESFDYIKNFYHLHHGNAIGFRFKDPTDYLLIDAPAFWNSHLHCYQICSSHGLFDRNITLPDVASLKVTMNSKRVDFTYLDKGKFTINTASPTDRVLVSCSFTIPVRFDSESLELSTNLSNGHGLEINLIEILE